MIFDNIWRRWLDRPHRLLPPGKTRRQSRFRPSLEQLESRELLSGSATPLGYTPAQIRQAYGFNQISFGGVAGDGTGTTIAIIDAFDDPNIASDLINFDAQFGLPNPTFTKVNQTGGSTPPTATGVDAEETALDVEWAHAIAPKASILLVEANSLTLADVMAATAYAAKQPGVVAVSLSLAMAETSGETADDSTFLTPAGHAGVTFVASSGDLPGVTPQPAYPASSPNVLSVGGTLLNLNGAGNIISETAWSNSVGGISAYEAQPSYQHGVVTQSTTKRTTPDVAYMADASSGSFPIYDSYDNGSSTPWSSTASGTSIGAPQWAALIAIADQGRIHAGLTPLNGPTQTLPKIYALPATDFHDITTGTSTGTPSYSAGPGYDLVTGRGSPRANLIVTGLIGSPVITSANKAVLTAGASGSFHVTAAGTLTFKLIGAPSWLSINASTGMLMGIPPIVTTSLVQTFTFTIDVSNGVTPDAMEIFSLTIVQPRRRGYA